MVQDFQESMEGVKKHLCGFTEPNKFLFVGEKVGSRFSPKMDHLVCFLPGTLGTGSFGLILTAVGKVTN